MILQGQTHCEPHQIMPFVTFHFDYLSMYRVNWDLLILRRLIESKLISLSSIAFLISVSNKDRFLHSE